MVRDSTEARSSPVTGSARSLRCKVAGKPEAGANFQLMADNPVATLLERLATESAFMNRVAAWQTSHPKEACPAGIPLWLHPRLGYALADRGITSLYSHQAEALEATRRGRNVLVTTGTASGKSLCFHLPVLQSLITDPGATALYIFPTKALARQQEEDLKRWLAALGGDPPPVTAYDGDSSPAERRQARLAAASLFTNPEMVHAGLLPAHERWARFWSRLAWVIIDEVHAYRGVTGAHMANLLRRLRRVCAHHGSRPLFLCASATVSDPAGLAHRLLGEHTELVIRDGGPRGTRHFLIIDCGRRHGPSLNEEGALLAFRFLREDIPTVVFSHTRADCEDLSHRLRLMMRDVPRGPDAVAPYRAGYLPEERRRLEYRLASGSLLGVVATSALEVGIDAGHLLVSLICGHPGSTAAIRQQAGRAGRRGQEAATILLAGGSHLDRYAALHPEDVLTSGLDPVPFDPDNRSVSDLHLLCAAGEIPLSPNERFGPENAGLRAGTLERSGRMILVDGRWHPRDPHPWRRVAVRSARKRRVSIVLAGPTPTPLGECELASSTLRLRPGASYSHMGTRYRVLTADLANGMILVTPTASPWTDRPPRLLYTVATKSVRAERVFFWLPSPHSPARLALENATLICSTPGHMPPVVMRMEVHAMRLGLPLPRSNGYLSYVTALGRLLRTAATAQLSCAPGDLALIVQPAAPPARLPVLTYYDTPPGGAGLAEALYKEIRTVAKEAAFLVSACPCERGCPHCIGAPPEKRGNAAVKARVGRLAAELALGLGGHSPS